MKRNNLIFLAISMIGLHAFSAASFSHGMGNGGDAVVCYTDATRSTITSVQMLDYWEQEQVLQYGQVDLGAPTLSVQDKIQIAVNRISKFDPDLADKIKFNALNLANNIQNYLVTSYQLPEIDDANPQVIPTQKNCFIEQYGVQYKDVITGQRRFAIADEFYNFLGTSNDDKAGLLLHEAIYRYAILQNPSLNNSDGIRYFNYIIGSAKIDQMTLNDLEIYLGFLKQASLTPKDCGKRVGSIYVKSNMILTCYNQRMSIVPDVFVEIYNGTRFTYYTEMGKISKIFFGYPHVTVAPKLQIKSGIYYPTGALNIDFKNSVIEIDLDQFKISAPLLYLENGPLGIDFKCDVGFVFNYASSDILKCKTTEVITFKGQNFIFDAIEKVADDRWLVENNWQILNPPFSLLGSKDNLKVLVGTYDRIIIDSNLNIVEGNAFLPNNSPQVEFNGTKYGMTKFKVFAKGSSYELFFETVQGEFSNPKIQGLRVLMPTNYPSSFAGIDFLCQVQGYKGGLGLNFASDYVKGLGESFYDLESKAVTYKADEDVRYISVLHCDKFSIQTSLY